jgi:hypothetical protein
LVDCSFALVKRHDGRDGPFSSGWRSLLWLTSAWLMLRWPTGRRSG